MDETEERAAALRAEIDRLKTVLSLTVDEAQRHEVHRRINICIRQSLALIEHRQQTY
jgi:hypothetical protein